jgi:hypothetical protein
LAYKDKAHLYLLYIREAHPVGPKQSPANVRAGIKIEDPKTREEREQIARDFASQFKVGLPILVDTIDDHAGKAYTAMPDRIYIIDAQGKIAYKGAPGPSGFRATDVPTVLDKLLGVSIANSLKLPMPKVEGEGDDETHERLKRMLAQLEVEEKDTGAILKSADRRMRAYRELMQVRRELMAAVREKQDTTDALTAYAKAQKKYEQSIAKIDQDLNAEVGYEKRAELKSLLTALGLLGNPPGPPMIGPSRPQE